MGRATMRAMTAVPVIPAKDARRRRKSVALGEPLYCETHRLTCWVGHIICSAEDVWSHLQKRAHRASRLQLRIAASCGIAKRLRRWQRDDGASLLRALLCWDVTFASGYDERSRFGDRRGRLKVDAEGDDVGRRRCRRFLEGRCLNREST